MERQTKRQRQKDRERDTERYTHTNRTTDKDRETEKTDDLARGRERDVVGRDRIAAYRQVQTLGHITTSPTVHWPSTADAETKVPFC